MTIMVLAVAVAMAQAPEKFSYQAVVRNASNALVTDSPVGIRISLMQGGVNGNIVFRETHTAITNANGLVTIAIGSGNLLEGSIVGIDWANGPYFLKTEIDPNGGSNYTISSEQQLLSVPYALYSKEAGNGFSGDYNDLTNRPQIPQTVGELTNDANYITMDSVPAIPTNVSAFYNDVPYLTAEQQILSISHDTIFLTGGSFVKLPEGFGGDYNSLTNKPTIPTTVGELTNDAGYITMDSVPTNVSAFINDAGYITKDSVPAIPTNVSTFTNDAGYLSSYTETDPQFNAWDKNYNDLTNKPTLFSGSYNDLTNKPTLFSGNYNDLTNKPSLFDGDYNSLSNKPVLFSGNYNDLSNRPTLFDGDYNSLSNRPMIPTVPDSVSAFINDAGYITAADVQAAAGIPTNVSAFTNDAGYITANDVPAQMNADWNATTGVAAILNKPTIPTVPTNVGAFTNDAHYITEAQLNALLAAMNNTIDSLRDRIENLENGEPPVIPDTVNSDTTVTPGTSFIMDGLACPGTPTVTDYDGIEYPTVAIGQQCWMKENLRTRHYADGISIPLQENGTTTSTTDRYCYHVGGNASNDYPYGLLYNWLAVMYGGQSYNGNPSNVRGVCPTGWHVPSNAEWGQLKQYVSSRTENLCGSSNNIAKSLASTTNWTSNSISCTVGDYAPNNNNTGFSALPAGDNSGNMGTTANFWSCYQSSSTQAYAFQLENTSVMVAQNGNAEKSSGYSVRCVRDSAVAMGDAQLVVTGNLGSITTTTASCSGTVNSVNSLQVTERGVCWSQMPNPNITDPIPTVVGGHTFNSSGTGSFSASITGLQPGTTYYVRAYAITNAGTAYGNTVTFTTQSDNSACGTATITDRDGYSYPTVKIGNQCWMKENLRTKHYADGTGILSGSTTSSTVAYYYTPSNGYGLLYNWMAVMHGASSSTTNPSGVRGICPIGWHVPSDGEWDELEYYVSSQSDYVCGNNNANIAKALAAATGWSPSTNDCAVGNEPSANNATGFGALPAGYYNSNGYSTSGNDAIFWSATERASGSAWYRCLGSNGATLYRYSGSRHGGFSVRCLRD